MKPAQSLLLTAVLLTPVLAEKRIRQQDLPAPVQAAIQEQTANATLVGISSEMEKGKITYEVETMLDGKARTVTLDSAGFVLEVEEEVGLDSLPAPAKAAIQKRAGTGTIGKVEKLSAGSSISYEAVVTTKAGKKTEVAVNPDGTRHHEK